MNTKHTRPVRLIKISTGETKRFDNAQEVADYLDLNVRVIHNRSNDGKPFYKRRYIIEP